MIECIHAGLLMYLDFSIHMHADMSCSDTNTYCTHLMQSANEHDDTRTHMLHETCLPLWQLLHSLLHHCSCKSFIIAHKLQRNAVNSLPFPDVALWADSLGKLSSDICRSRLSETKARTALVSPICCLSCSMKPGWLRLLSP